MYVQIGFYQSNHSFACVLLARCLLRVQVRGERLRDGELPLGRVMSASSDRLLRHTNNSATQKIYSALRSPSTLPHSFSFPNRTRPRPRFLFLFSPLRSHPIPASNIAFTCEEKTEYEDEFEYEDDWRTSRSGEGRGRERGIHRHRNDRPVGDQATRYPRHRTEPRPAR
jgi:hypothetical protein